MCSNPLKPLCGLVLTWSPLTGPLRVAPGPLFFQLWTIPHLAITPDVCIALVLCLGKHLFISISLPHAKKWDSSNYKNIPAQNPVSAAFPHTVHSFTPSPVTQSKLIFLFTNLGLATQMTVFFLFFLVDKLLWLSTGRIVFPSDFQQFLIVVCISHFSSTVAKYQRQSAYKKENLFWLSGFSPVWVAWFWGLWGRRWW